MSPRLVLPSQTRTISDRDLAAAGTVRDRAVAAVEERPEYVRAYRIDPRFAYPDANWAQDGPNPFVELFWRVGQCDAETIGQLRAFCPIFTGYHLYEACQAAGLRAPQHLDAYTDDAIASKLETNNGPHIDRWTWVSEPLPLRCLFSPPWRFGEIGHEIKGVIVNSDTWTYQERISILYDAGVVDLLDGIAASRGEIRVLEIGGGYGALASWFKAAYPTCSYTILDLPESLLFSALYLTLSRPDLATSWGTAPTPFGIRFIPNYMAGALTEKFDLIINTLSMSEMTEFQIRCYFDLMKTQWINEDGIFFEQNQDNRMIGFPCAQNILAEMFPYRLVPQIRLLLDIAQGAPNLWSMAPISLVPPAV